MKAAPPRALGAGVLHTRPAAVVHLCSSPAAVWQPVHFSAFLDSFGSYAVVVLFYPI